MSDHDLLVRIDEKIASIEQHLYKLNADVAENTKFRHQARAVIAAVVVAVPIFSAVFSWIAMAFGR